MTPSISVSKTQFAPSQTRSITPSPSLTPAPASANSVLDITWSFNVSGGALNLTSFTSSLATSLSISKSSILIVSDQTSGSVETVGIAVFCANNTVATNLQSSLNTSHSTFAGSYSLVEISYTATISAVVLPSATRSVSMTRSSTKSISITPTTSLSRGASTTPSATPSNTNSPAPSNANAIVSGTSDLVTDLSPEDFVSTCQDAWVDATADQLGISSSDIDVTSVTSSSSKTTNALTILYRIFFATAASANAASATLQDPNTQQKILTNVNSNSNANIGSIRTVAQAAAVTYPSPSASASHNSASSTSIALPLVVAFLSLAHFLGQH